MLPQNIPIVDLTETSNSEHKSVHNNDYEEDDLPTWNLSPTDYVENYETKDTFDPDKA